MTTSSLFRAIGLMSGTSMDGIDVAVIETDGDARLTLGPHASRPYPSDLRHTLLHLPGNGINVETAEREVTDRQSQAVRALCVDSNIDLSSVNVVGFHGQTIRHDPQNGKTWQLGNGQHMADTLCVNEPGWSSAAIRSPSASPAPLLLAANRLSVAPEDCTYIGDAERDVLAARAAGMKVFVAMFGYIGVDERPMEWPATGWLDTPKAMCSFLEGLRTKLRK